MIMNFENNITANITESHICNIVKNGRTESSEIIILYFNYDRTILTCQNNESNKAKNHYVYNRHTDFLVRMI